MGAGARSLGEQASIDEVQESIKAWWHAALAGEGKDSHPLYGTRVCAALKDGVLIVSGDVPGEQERRELEAYAAEVGSEQGREIRCELAVTPDSSEEPGLLNQRLLGIFENADQAAFASGYLESHARLSTGALTVLSAGGREPVERVVPAAYVEDVRAALEAGRSVVVVTVDETEAFKVRELLDEETSSLETVVAPPEVAEPGPRAAQDEQPGAGTKREPGATS